MACLASRSATVAVEKRASYRDQEYWGRPVPGFGDPRARILVLGLAPAAHGANRTGRVFTGDRSGDWLLVDAKSGAARQAPPAWVKKHNQPPDDGQPVELYNLRDDIGQRHNLAAKHPERVSELQALLKKLREQGHSAPRLH